MLLNVTGSGYGKRMYKPAPPAPRRAMARLYMARRAMARLYMAPQSPLLSLAQAKPVLE